MPRLVPTPKARDLPAGFEPMHLALTSGGFSLELLQPECLVGRHSHSDLRLPCPDVSRRHCRLFFADGAWHVGDLHSLNGVYVNDEKVKQCRLHVGDRVRLGGFTFVVLPPVAAIAPARAA